MYLDTSYSISMSMLVSITHGCGSGGYTASASGYCILVSFISENENHGVS